MIKPNILRAKIKRNGLEKYAGKYFRDDSSSIVEAHNNEGDNALVGIQKNEDLYTIIGEKSVHFSTKNGITGTMPISEFLELLHDNAMSRGKLGRFKYLRLTNGDSIWLNNRSTMESLMNLILWLEKLEESR